MLKLVRYMKARKRPKISRDVVSVYAKKSALVHSQRLVAVRRRCLPRLQTWRFRVLVSFSTGPVCQALTDS